MSGPIVGINCILARVFIHHHALCFEIHFWNRTCTSLSSTISANSSTASSSQKPLCLVGRRSRVIVIVTPRSSCSSVGQQLCRVRSPYCCRIQRRRRRQHRHLHHNISCSCCRSCLCRHRQACRCRRTQIRPGQRRSARLRRRDVGIDSILLFIGRAVVDKLHRCVVLVELGLVGHLANEACVLQGCCVVCVLSTFSNDFAQNEIFEQNGRKGETGQMGKKKKKLAQNHFSRRRKSCWLKRGCGSLLCWP